MREALHIFMKDSRHQRVPIALMLAWTALFAGATALAFSLTRAASPLGPYEFAFAIVQFSPYVLGLGWCFVLVRAVHADALDGDTQFWLTRPYRRGSLLAAKLLFVIAYVAAPLAIAQAAIAALAGIPPGSFIASWVWSQVLMLAVVGVPMLAIASTTASAGWLAGSLIPVVLTLSFVVTKSQELIGLGWVRYSIAGAVALVVAGFVLWMQYGWRKTRWSQLALLLGLTVAMGAASLINWQTAFSIQQRVTGKGGSTLSASLAAPAELPFEVPRSSKQFWMRFALEGVTPETLVLCEATQLTVTNASGAQLVKPVLQVQDGRLTQASDGCTSFLVLPQDSASFVTAPVTLSGDVYLTVFGPAQTTPLPMDESQAVPGYGVCTASTRPSLEVQSEPRFRYAVCTTAFRAPAVASSVHSGGEPTALYRPSYSPWPGGLQVQPVELQVRPFRVGDTTTSATTHPVVAFARLPVHAVNVDLKTFGIPEPR